MNNIVQHEFIVFAYDHYNPLGVIRSLGENGIKPIFIAVKHKVDLGIKSKYIKQFYSVQSVEEGYKCLLSIIDRASQKPFLITCDDKTTGFLDDRFLELRDKIYFFNAGQQGRINEFMRKDKILNIAKKHGLNILDTHVVTKGEIPCGLEYPIITKSISPNDGGWKSDVFICESEDDLLKAFSQIKSSTVLLQKFIKKRNELCIDGFSALKGEQCFFGIASKYKYLIQGYYSPFMDVFDFNDEKIEKCLRNMLKEIGFDGVFSIEFLEDSNGDYYFCEVNFRNSTWSYASTVCGMPLPLLWATACVNVHIDKTWKKHVPKDFTAMVEPVDYEKRKELNLSNFIDWLPDFKKCNCPFYYGKGEDLVPFYEMIKNWDKLK